MKKVIYLVSFMVMTLMAVGMVSATDISTCAELQTMSSGGNYVLVNDIDCSGFDYGDGKGFNPVDLGSGTFDGKGYVIKNLYINRPGNNQVGLFKQSSGTISNVGLENVAITGNGAVGGLVGKNQAGGTISKSYVTGGSVTGGAKTGDAKVGAGGLVGRNTGEITDSYASVSVTGYKEIGGLVGGNHEDKNHVKGTISNSYATGNVTATVNRPGGLVGYNAGIIKNCYATGDVTGRWPGGLSSYNPGGTIENCYATGSVSGEAAGGLISGSGGATAINSYCSGLNPCNCGGTYINESTFYSKENEPLASWDFENIWRETSGGFPEFIWTALPPPKGPVFFFR